MEREKPKWLLGERKKERDTRGTASSTEREGEKECVCVCVCVRERERERELVRPVIKKDSWISAQTANDSISFQHIFADRVKEQSTETQQTEGP